MIQLYIRYFLTGKSIKNWFARFSSASLRYTEPDTGLIQNLKVSSIVPYLSYQNSIYWWSKSTLSIFSTSKFIWNRFAQFHYCHVFFEIYGTRCRVDTKSSGKFNWLFLISPHNHFCIMIHLLIWTYTRYLFIQARFIRFYCCHVFFEVYGTRCSVDAKSLGEFNWLSLISPNNYFCV